MLEAIRKSAKNLSSGIIDIPLYNKEIIEGLSETGVNAQEGFYDLRLLEINSLERNEEHSFFNCNTWKEAVEKLECKEWDEAKVINWFTTPIFDTPFPVEDSKSELRIGIVGGARFCKLGNHRLAAAKVWMLDNKPKQPTLQKVHYYYYPVEPTAIRLLRDGLQNDVHVSFGLDGTGLKHLFVQYKKKWELYQLRDGYELIKSGRCKLMGKLHSRNYTLELIPKPLIEVLLNDTWPNI